MPDLIVLVSYEAFQYTINKPNCLVSKTRIDKLLSKHLGTLSKHLVKQGLLNCLVSKTRIDNPLGGSMVDAHESTELCLVGTPRGYH